MRVKYTLVLLIAFGVCMNDCQAFNFITALDVLYKITKFAVEGINAGVTVVSEIENFYDEAVSILEDGQTQTKTASTDYTAIPYVFLTNAEEFENATYKSDRMPLVLNKTVDVWPNATTSISGSIQLTPELCSGTSHYTHICVIYRTTDAEDKLDNDACTPFDGCTTSGATSANIVGWYVMIPLTIAAAVGWFVQ
ncbi:uncharacterized protein [Ptychodera flava]|uniref:uncharacterized protein n=1 Tax=Ptychodera flava TaxID=63121 RepID=UPI00396A10C0